MMSKLDQAVDRADKRVCERRLVAAESIANAIEDKTVTTHATAAIDLLTRAVLSLADSVEEITRP